MTRNTKSEVTATDTVTDVTVTDVTVTDAPTVTESYVPTLDSVVDAYVAGNITKRDAAKFADAAIASAIESMNIDDAMAANVVKKALDAATRTPAKKVAVIDPDVYVSAIVRRVWAMRAYAEELASGRVMPSDVPDDDTVRVAIREALNAHMYGYHDDDADSLDSARDYVSARVVSGGNMVRHIESVRDGSATKPDGTPLVIAIGDVVTMNTIATARTAEYPNGPSGGHVASRFVGKPEGHIVAGFTYADTVDGKRGVRRVS